MQEYKNLVNNQKVKRKQQQTPRLAAVLSFSLNTNRWLANVCLNAPAGTSGSPHVMRETDLSYSSVFPDTSGLHQCRNIKILLTIKKLSENSNSP
jgi:hypothetical protein